MATTTPVRKHRRGFETTPGTRGVICFLIRKQGQSIRSVASQLGLPQSTVGDIARRSAAISEANIGHHSSITASLPRSGRPLLLSSIQIDSLITAATATYSSRRKSWMDIAKELGIDASKSTIVLAFESRGYKRYSSRHKPWLTPEQRLFRLEWCTIRSSWGLTEWGLVLWSDETSCVLGEIRGTNRVTRLPGEEWDDDCTEKTWKEVSTMMLWGSIAYGYKGPCHIYAKETTALRKASLNELKILNDAREIDEHSEWDIEQTNIDARHESNGTQRRGTRPLWENQFKPYTRSIGGGIDWYRYNREILRPVFLPAYQEFRYTRPGALLMQDGCSNHTSKWNKAIFIEFMVDLLDWPGNSPDLNPIEHIWRLLKDRVAARRPFVRGRIGLEEAWINEWDKLSIENDINPLILLHIKRVSQVVAAQGNNNFHG